MNGTSDIDQAIYGNDGELDAGTAARLLDQTQRDAKRALDFRSPWLSLVAAAVVLVGFGSVWLSVRDQHPFTGPGAGSLVVLYALVAIRIGTVAYSARHATAGLSGRSLRKWRAEAVALAAALLAVYLLMAALIHAGASHPAVYWVYAVSATLIVLGTFWAARSAVQQDWPELGVAIAVMLVAAASACTGPRGMWLGDGVGLGVVLLVETARQAWLRRASSARA
jgi:hypothetical protein